MSHYAHITNGVVDQVIVAEQDFIDTLPDSVSWIQTSYNTRGGIHYDPQTGLPSLDQTKALRKNYASLGDIYDANLDAFISPQPFPSWKLNTETCEWEAPVVRPEDTFDEIYYWDEPSLKWIAVSV